MAESKPGHSTRMKLRGPLLDRLPENLQKLRKFTAALFEGAGIRSALIEDCNFLAFIHHPKTFRMEVDMEIFDTEMPSRTDQQILNWIRDDLAYFLAYSHPDNHQFLIRLATLWVQHG